MLNIFQLNGFFTICTRGGRRSPRAHSRTECSTLCSSSNLTFKFQHALEFKQERCTLAGQRLFAPFPAHGDSSDTTGQREHANIGLFSYRQVQSLWLQAKPWQTPFLPALNYRSRPPQRRAQGVHLLLRRNRYRNNSGRYRSHRSPYPRRHKIYKGR